ncbi:hypothetical protein GS429_02525 [Natronorubrum sp. JWXQ-INN-674]|uniref:Uncharacterized protein n=1 Tax=Natronorubrum halalkaliphilum TaxID=2691917 RepID=A0A6B0VIN8_9EURY|nr:hypothetical protein [Natronorubrum halalkaliphilum]MXV60957.1 hypothetical protein [Natronorubrum halalkaliphilum]
MKTLVKSAAVVLQKEGPVSLLTSASSFTQQALTSYIISKQPRLYPPFLQLRQHLSRHKFTDADPLKIIFIDPTNIVYQSPPGRSLQRGVVRDGDWDQSSRKFLQNRVPQALVSHFEDDVPWESTGLYDEFREKTNQGNAWGFSSLSAFEERCQEIDDLYYSIQENGYYSQAELLNAKSEETRKRNNQLTPTHLNEVTIDIGRDGQLLWRNFGQHRLTIAKILELDKIPVLVCTRHKEWQQVRDKIRFCDDLNELEPEFKRYLDHPDIEQIVLSNEP